MASTKALRAGLVGIPELKARYDQALACFRAGRYDTAEDILTKLVITLNRITVSSSAFVELEPAHYHLLRASAQTLLGRVQERQGRQEEALASFSQAIPLFEEWLPKVGEGVGFFHKDYGMALECVGRKDEAFTVFQKAVMAAVADVETFSHLGKSLHQRQRYQEAEGYLRRALELDPDDPLPYRLLGENLEAQGKHDVAVNVYLRGAAMAADRPVEALDLLERALIADPDNPTALAAKADALATQDRHLEALEALDRALQIDPSHVAALATKGEVLSDLGRDDEALVVLDEALRHNPDDPITLAVRGEALKRLGRLDEALQSLHDALDLSPDHVGAVTTKAEVLAALGRHDEALILLDRALALSPDDRAALISRAKVLKVLDRDDEALVAIDLVLQGGVDPDLFETKARILRHAGRPEEALEAVDQALEAAPESAVAMATRGAVLVALGRYNEALATLDQALERNREDAFALTVRAETLLWLGRHDDALVAVEDVLARDPGDPSALRVKGAVLEGLGRHPDALATLDEALELDSEMADALAAKGRVLRTLHRLDEAAEVLRRAAELDPDSVPIHEQLAKVLRSLGRYEEAIETVDRVIELVPGDLEWSRNKAYMLIALRRTREAIKTLRELDAPQGKATATLRADLGFAQLRDDDYDGVRVSLDEALQQDPKHAWARCVEGAYYCNIAEYQTAIETLTKAVKADPSDDWPFGLMGWAYQSLCTLELTSGGQRVQAYAEEAEHAYETALELAPDNLSWLLCAGEALHLLGRDEEAREQYKLVTEHGHEEASDEVTVQNLNTRAWAYYRLGQYPEAVRLYIESLSLDSDLIDMQFNLALASACNRQHRVGLREYQRGLRWSKRKRVHVLRRRGLLSVALADLREARLREPSLAEAPEVTESEQLLEEALGQAASEASGENGGDDAGTEVR